MANSKVKSSVPASESFTIDGTVVNVHVNGILRNIIPGSFSVHLLKNGEPIASKAFFQSSGLEVVSKEEPESIYVDFRLALQDVMDGTFEVWVELMDKSYVGNRFPPKLMGNPSVSVQFLLQQD